MKLSAPIFRLKQRARQMARESNILLSNALDLVARREGFRSWSQLAASQPKKRPTGKILAELRPGAQMSSLHSESMKQLSKDDIQSLKRRLQEWQSPADMSDTVGGVRSPTFFIQAGLEFLRDAWTAALFAKCVGYEWVRLVDDSWQDFEVMSTNEVVRFEVVEADNPSRRRGDEYRDPDYLKSQPDPVEQWVERADAAPDWLRHAVKKKAAKRYSPGTNLLIYLNLGEYGIRQKEVEACFADCTMAAKDSFKQIWILWKAKAYLVWENGERADTAVETLIQR